MSPAEDGRVGTLLAAMLGDHMPPIAFPSPAGWPAAAPIGFQQDLHVTIRDRHGGSPRSPCAYGLAKRSAPICAMPSTPYVEPLTWLPPHVLSERPRRGQGSRAPIASWSRARCLRTGLPGLCFLCHSHPLKSARDLTRFSRRSNSRLQSCLSKLTQHVFIGGDCQ
jgi:hypothetical protein